MMIQDIASTQKEHVDDQIGTYNKKFAETYGKEILKRFGPNASYIAKTKMTVK